MSDICLVLPCNLYVAPFYYRYEKMLIGASKPFDLIYWNRAGIQETSSADRIMEYPEPDRENDGNALKFAKFLKFARFVKHHLAEPAYDRVVFLSTYAGNGLFLANFLSKRFRYRYWLDIRDYTYEWFPLYRRLLFKTITNAKYVSISSPGFKEFLIDYPYIITHNIENDLMEAAIHKRSAAIADNNAIRISFIGNVRYFSENVWLMEQLKNDPHFVLQYFGSGSAELADYARQHQIENVRFLGRFSPAETPDLYAQTDIINNIYGNDGLAKSTALSNKLYFAIALQIPILVSPSTYVAEITKELGIGFEVNSGEDFARHLLDWYRNLTIDRERLNQAWNTICHENEEFNETFTKFLNEEMLF